MGEIVLHLPSDLEEGIENLVSRGIYKEKEGKIGTEEEKRLVISAM